MELQEALDWIKQNPDKIKNMPVPNVATMALKVIGLKIIEDDLVVNSWGWLIKRSDAEKFEYKEVQNDIV